MDTEYLVRIKYAGMSFHSIAWIFISVNVTIYRTIPIQRYQGSSNSGDRIIIAKIRSCVWN